MTGKTYRGKSTHSKKRLVIGATINPSQTQLQIQTFAKKNPAAKVEAVKDIAKAVVDRNKPTHIGVVVDPRTQYNNSYSLAADLRPLLPHIWQVGQDSTPGNEVKATVETRTGNKVHLQHINFRGIITIPPIDSPTSSDRSLLACRLLVFSCDKYKTHTALTNNWAAGDMLRQQLLRQGASAKEFDGTLERIWLPVNSSLFTTHVDRRFYIARGQQIINGAGAERVMSYFPSGCSYKAFNYGVKCKNKVMHYANPTDSKPSNYSPCAYLMYAYVNGAAASAAAVPFMQFTATTKFKDE